MNEARAVQPSIDVPQQPAPMTQIVTFAIGDQVFGIDIMSVREIRMLSSLTMLPGAPDHIRGVMNLRGSIVPVSDLRVRLGEALTELSPTKAVVIVAASGKLTGLVVDTVLDILTVDASHVSSAQDVDAWLDRTWLQGLLTLPAADGANASDRVVILIDIDRLLNASSLAPPARKTAGLHR